jgi:hypothetical protein
MIGIRRRRDGFGAELPADELIDDKRARRGNKRQRGFRKSVGLRN